MNLTRRRRDAEFFPSCVFPCLCRFPFSCGGGHLEARIRVSPRSGKRAGFVETLLAGDQLLEFGARKNELLGWEIGGWAVGFALAFCPLREEHGFFEGLLTGGQAFGPQSAELGHVTPDGALDTLLVKRQQLDVPASREP